MTVSRLRWWWVRHAQTADPGVYMKEDVELKRPLDETILEVLGNILPASAQWLSAPERRCLETIANIQTQAVYKAEQISVVESLCEQNFGAWIGQSVERVIKQSPQIGGSGEASAVVPEGGESFRSVCARVSAFMNATTQGLQEADELEHLVLCAHTSTIRAALAHVLHVSPKDALHIHIDPLSLTCMDYYNETNSWVIRTQNWSAFPNLS